MKTTRFKRLALALVAALFILSGCNAGKAVKTAENASQKIPEETSWMYHAQVDAEFVKVHISMPMPEGVMLIDARPYKNKYAKGHIPGAVSIPFSEFDKKADLLPADKETLLIYYCEGPHCKLSHKSAYKAEKLGYKNIRVYTAGYPEWVTLKGNYGSVSVEYVAAQIALNKTLIVDARPLKTKYVKGHIPTAVSIPFSQFDELSGKLPRDIATPIIFYCGGLECRLSHKSAARVLEMGYSDVKVFSLGYPEWKKQYGASKETVQVAAGEIEGSIDLERFKAIIEKNSESIMLIDVRDSDEFAKGSFKTAVNIPVEKLEPKIETLPADKPVVFVCSTGARSGEAYYMVKDIRESLKDVYYVEAQISFKGDGVYEIKKPK